MEGKAIKVWLTEHGASPQQVNSKVVDMIAQAMTDEQISVSETARNEVKRLADKVDRADYAADKLFRGINNVEGRYSKVQELLSQAEADAKNMTISDQAVIDATIAFRRVLEYVRDVFGEDEMTESVICAAIEAGSYCMWRSVMGPKDSQHGRRVL